MPTRLGMVPPSAEQPDYCLRSYPRVKPVSLATRVGLALVLLFVTLIVDAGGVNAHAPHDDVADIAVSPAYAEDRTVFAIVRTRLMRSTDGGRTWKEIVRGMDDETQVLTRVAVAPSDKEVMYLTTRRDGVLKSEDAGTSWQAANRGLTNLNLQEIAVSPSSADIVVAGGAVGGGLFRTTNGGASWSAVEGFDRVTSMAFQPDGSRLLVGDGEGRLTTSGDAGSTWDAVLTLAQGDAVTAIATGATADTADIVFAATASGRLFRSDDGGRSFTPLGDGLPHEEVRSLELSPDYVDDTTLWASTWHSGVFRSADAGETWEPMTDGLTTDPMGDDLRVPQFRTLATAVDRSGDESLFVGGFDGLFRYDEHRGTWRQVETLTDYIVGLAVSPDFGDDRTIAVTTYVKGTFVSQDRGGTWRFANEGLTVDELGSGNKFAPLRRLGDVVFSPDYANDGTILSANWVRIVKSTDRGASWKEIDVSPPPPGETLRQFVLAVSPSYSSDQTIFTATRQGEVFRSEGAGEHGTWTKVDGFDERVRSLAVSPDYANDRVLYAGTVVGVYISHDGGDSWNAAGPRMATQTQGRDIEPGALVAISPGYGEDGTVFAGTDSGLFVTRDAGRSWTVVTAEPLTASSQIEAVAVSPDYQNDRTVLVSTRERGLLRSTNGGTTFRAVGTELTEGNHLVADFSNPTSEPIQFSPSFATDRTIFAYAQTEVVRSTDGGDSWEILHLPSGNAVLESLGIEPRAPANGDDRRVVGDPDRRPVGATRARRRRGGDRLLRGAVGSRCGRPPCTPGARSAPEWRRRGARRRAGGARRVAGSMRGCLPACSTSAAASATAELRRHRHPVGGLSTPGVDLRPLDDPRAFPCKASERELQGEVEKVLRVSLPMEESVNDIHAVGSFDEFVEFLGRRRVVMQMQPLVGKVWKETDSSLWGWAQINT